MFGAEERSIVSAYERFDQIPCIGAGIYIWMRGITQGKLLS